MRILNTLPVRLGVMAVIAFKVVDDLFATLLTLAYRLAQSQAAGFLGRQTPGDDYQRLAPLMDAVPIWLHGLWVAAAVLYLGAIVLILLHRRQAYAWVLLAFGFELAASLLGRPIVAASGVVVNPNPSFLAAVVIPFIVPLGLAAVLWLAARRSDEAQAHA